METIWVPLDRHREKRDFVAATVTAVLTNQKAEATGGSQCVTL